MPSYRHATADVFTDRMFHGNPVAVILKADGLSAGQMQAIAREFNYVETTFVLPPRDASHAAWVRIFTPSREIPFAGHPNIGTPFVFAKMGAARGEDVPDQLVFEASAPTAGRGASHLHPVSHVRDRRDDFVVSAAAADRRVNASSYPA